MTNKRYKHRITRAESALKVLQVLFQGALREPSQQADEIAGLLLIRHATPRSEYLISAI
jgi:hypothetical protein